MMCYLQCVIVSWINRFPAFIASHSGITVSSGMEEMPSLNMPVQRLKVAILPLDSPCSGPITHSGEILTTGKSHGKKPDRFSLNDDTDVKKVLRFKYATWNIRGLGEKEEELDKILNENNIKHQ